MTVKASLEYHITCDVCATPTIIKYTETEAFRQRDFHNRTRHGGVQYATVKEVI